MGFKANITEKSFQQQVVRLAVLCRWERIFHPYDSRRSAPGFPDLLLIRGGELVVAELKVGNNKTTPAQDGWLKAFACAGAKAFVWYPADWPEIEKVLGVAE